MIEKKKSVDGLNEQQFQIRAWQDRPSLSPFHLLCYTEEGKARGSPASGGGRGSLGPAPGQARPRGNCLGP